MPTIENTGATQVAQTQAIVANQNLADNSEVVGQTSDARTVTQTTETKSFCRKVLDVFTFPFRKIYQFACYVCNKIRNFVRGNKEASLNKTEDQQKVENNQADTSKAKTLPQANATKEAAVKENGKSNEENGDEKTSASSLAKNQAGVTVVKIPSFSEEKKDNEDSKEVSNSSDKTLTGNGDSEVRTEDPAKKVVLNENTDLKEVIETSPSGQVKEAIETSPSDQVKEAIETSPSDQVKEEKETPEDSTIPNDKDGDNVGKSGDSATTQETAEKSSPSNVVKKDGHEETPEDSTTSDDEKNEEKIAVVENSDKLSSKDTLPNGPSSI